MTRLSEDLVKQMCKMISEGRASFDTLADELQISKSSVQRWSNHGNHLLELHDGEREKTLNDIYANYTKGDKKYACGCVHFVTDVPAAFAVLKGKLETVVLAEGMQNPDMALKILERWDPPQWAKQVHIKQEVETRQITTIIEHVQEPRQLEERNPIEAEFDEV